MNRFDLKKEPATARGVTFFYGAAQAGLLERRASDQFTYLYLQSPALLYAENTELLLPAKSISAIKPGTELRLRVTEKEQEQPSIVMRVAAGMPALADEELSMINTPYELNRKEWNSMILEHLDGKVTVFPLDSRENVRALREGKLAKRGWYANSYKEQVLAATVAEWKEIRSSEQYHAHHIISEMYVGISGRSRMLVNDELYDLAEGNLIHVLPGEPHKVDSIIVGSDGYFRQLVAQYPPLSYDATEKIVINGA